MGIHKFSFIIFYFELCLRCAVTEDTLTSGRAEPSLKAEPDADDNPKRSRHARSGETLATHFNSKINLELLARPAGSSVALKCPAVANPPADVVWLKNGKVPTREFNKEIVYKKYSLLMENLQLSDAGTFQCIVSNATGKVKFSFLLDIEETVPHRPLFRDGFPSNTSVHLGGRARLECRFVGDLSPRMIWFKHFVINGSYADSSGVPYVQPLESSVANTTDPHVLQIDPVTIEDEGYYTCLAGNSIGVSYRSAYLRVLSLPEQYIAKEKSLELTDDNSSIIITVAVLVTSLLVVFALLMCRLKYNTVKRKSDIKSRHMVVTKKIVLEKGEDPNSIVPFVKIDYNTVLSTETSPGLEYEFPVDLNWEFPREKLKLGDLLGEGAFARVVRGDASFTEEGPPTTVAVKMLKEDHLDADVIALFSEIQLMKVIGTHANVLSLRGCCTKGGPLYAIVEYAERGNLRDYLRDHRNPTRPPSGYEVPIGMVKPPTLSPDSLISFAHQTAQGMAYLASRGCIHRDLAARNILLAQNNVIKIADFGLSRDLHPGDPVYFMKNSKGKLPIKWLAPEALCDRVFSSKSDVWAFGILLFEIFTLGATPYPAVPCEHLYQKLKSGYRMPKPDLCPQHVYILMKRCWDDAPKNRPNFGEIVSILDGMLKNFSNMNYAELDLSTSSAPENSSSDEES